MTIDDFEFIKMIGKGAYGKVWLVRKKGMGDLYAMKIIQCTDAVNTMILSLISLETQVGIY